jgi:geranylgeranylglycerol-phosphate geranylgeranyltransferase
VDGLDEYLLARIGTVFASIFAGGKTMLKFLKEYVKSMRLYYSFVTGLAGWIGVAYSEYAVDFVALGTTTHASAPAKKLVILALAFLSWGINQIINDYLGLKEDRINAPERPMVTGDLDPHKALLLSIFFIIASAFVTWFYLEPVAIIFLLAGVMLNVLYETAKGHGIWGNIVFGLMISMATLYGFYAMGPVKGSLGLLRILPVLALLCTVNGLMTLYTYFKDYQGDRRTGKKTLIVIWGLKKSRVRAFIGAFLPLLVFVFLKTTNKLSPNITREFIILGSLVLLLQIRTGALFYLKPVGKSTYTSLGVNFKACVCAEAALLALYNPALGVQLFIISYFAVTVLFLLHKNAKA